MSAASGYWVQDIKDKASRYVQCKCVIESSSVFSYFYEYLDDVKCSLLLLLQLEKQIIQAGGSVPQVDIN